MLVGSCLPHTCALSPPHPLTPQYGGLLKPLHFWGHSVAQDDPFGDVQSGVRWPRDARLGEPYRDRDGTSLPRSPPRAPPCPLSPLCPAPPRHPPSSPCPVLSPHPAPGAAGGALRADYSSRHAPGSLCLRSRTPRPSAVPRGRPASGTDIPRAQVEKIPWVRFLAATLRLRNGARGGPPGWEAQGSPQPPRHRKELGWCEA